MVSWCAFTCCSVSWAVQKVLIKSFSNLAYSGKHPDFVSRDDVRAIILAHTDGCSKIRKAAQEIVPWIQVLGGFASQNQSHQNPFFSD